MSYWKGFLRRTAKRKHRTRQTEKQKREKHCRTKPQPERRRRNFPCVLLLVFSKPLSNQARAACAKQIGNSRQHHKRWINKRNRRTLPWFIQKSHKIRIRKTVNQRNHLAYDRRYDLPAHSLPHWQLFKNLRPCPFHSGALSFRICKISYHSIFSIA